MDAQAEQILIDITIRAAVAAGEAIWNAIQKGDVSAVQELAKTLETADQMLASDAALKQHERQLAAAALATSVLNTYLTAPVAHILAYPREDIERAISNALRGPQP